MDTIRPEISYNHSTVNVADIDVARADKFYYMGNDDIVDAATGELVVANGGQLSADIIEAMIANGATLVQVKERIEKYPTQAPYMEVEAFMEGQEMIEPLHDRITGRYTVEDIINPETGEVIVEADKMISSEQADDVVAAGITKVKIRTILSCKCHNGVCSKCYGANMASGRMVRIGEAVGIVAAQSIGEPGTQLTMRTFHTGGVSGNDLTQGLPRVEELFEARKPKGVALVSKISGTVSIGGTPESRRVTVTTNYGESEEYAINYGSRVCVIDGDYIEAGDPITEGSINPHDIMQINGEKKVQDYILKEVQKVYRLQGVDINDKHIEVIVRQMLKRVKVETGGDTEFLPGAMVDWLEFEDANKEAAAEGKETASGIRTLLGITKASLATESFLSAASFQETTRVLTEAAIKGKTDKLIGLKENVIIGRLIPAGTGMDRYRKVDLKLDKPDATDEDEEQPKTEIDEIVDNAIDNAPEVDGEQKIEDVTEVDVEAEVEADVEAESTDAE
jgi:DNA-directed RNA polymerase subunit beta'